MKTTKGEISFFGPLLLVRGYADSHDLYTDLIPFFGTMRPMKTNTLARKYPETTVADVGQVIELFNPRRRMTRSPTMEPTLESLRAALADGVSSDQRAAGIAACRAIIAALDSTPGQPLPVATPPVVAGAVPLANRPLLDEFFTWARAARDITPGRNLATKALGYAVNQEAELRRVLDDGNLPLDNNRAERALRKIVVGRKNWLFYGSDTHAEAAAAIFSLLASCRLHRLDPFKYLDEVMRVLTYWPDERYLELAPKHWSATRSRLNADELDAPLASFQIPPPLASDPAAPSAP